MTGRHTLEQAFVLARSGRFRSVDDIARNLRDSGYEAVDAHLRGTGIRKELRAACKSSSRTG